VAEGVVEVDLAVVGVGRAAHQQGVEGAVPALLEHPRHDRGVAVVGDPCDLGGEGSVERLGVQRQVGTRVAEVAGEPLGQHDEIGAVRDELGEPPAVHLGFQGRRLLHQNDLHADKPATTSDPVP
jgi:hypothetical protein